MKENEIRPREIFEEYLRLAAADTKIYFDSCAKKDVPCPACGNRGEPTFDKSNFTYCLCPSCETLFVSPRPEAKAIQRYYEEAPSVEYWATTFYPTTASARREKIWKPKAIQLKNIVATHSPETRMLIDIGGGYGIFAEEYQRATNHEVIVIEPSPSLARASRERGLRVVEEFMEDLKPEDLPKEPKAFTSFELFEHLHNPKEFLSILLQIMDAGDLFVFSTLSGHGLDILELWEKSQAISPPHHLNFLNPSSVSILLKRVGLECLDVTTPGRLDVDILDNNRHLLTNRFWKTFLTHATEEAKALLQEAIRLSGWSSHMLVTCRKPARMQ